LSTRIASAIRGDGVDSWVKIGEEQPIAQRKTPQMMRAEIKQIIIVLRKVKKDDFIRTPVYNLGIEWSWPLKW
jgi:dTDP-glucose pyrophosphorylase